MRLFLVCASAFVLSLACAGPSDVPAPAPTITPIDAAAVEPAAEGEVPVAASPGSATEVPGSTPSAAAPTEPAAEGPAFPANLDPDGTKGNQREQALLDVYRFDDGPNVSGYILTVIKTDPDPHVRIVAADVVRMRWKAGTDSAGASRVATWCASSGDGSALRARCLRILGDFGDARAGAVIGGLVDSDDKEVREGANDGCQKWTERFPGQACGTFASKGRG